MAISEIFVLVGIFLIPIQDKVSGQSKKAESLL